MMILAMKLVALFLILIACVYGLKPERVKKMIAFWKQGKNIYFAGAARLVAALILLAGAPKAQWTNFVLVLGIAALLSGAAVFVLGPERSNRMLDPLENAPASRIRVIAGVVLAVGIALYLGI